MATLIISATLACDAGSTSKDIEICAVDRASEAPIRAYLATLAGRLQQPDLTGPTLTEALPFDKRIFGLRVRFTVRLTLQLRLRDSLATAGLTDIMLPRMKA